MSATLVEAALHHANASLALAASIRRSLARHPELPWPRPFRFTSNARILPASRGV